MDLQIQAQGMGPQVQATMHPAQGMEHPVGVGVQVDIMLQILDTMRLVLDIMRLVLDTMPLVEEEVEGVDYQVKTKLEQQLKN